MQQSVQSQNEKSRRLAVTDKSLEYACQRIVELEALVRANLPEICKIVDKAA